MSWCVYIRGKGTYASKGFVQINSSAVGDNLQFTQFSEAGHTTGNGLEQNGNTISLSTDLFISPNGNVGIGTTNPGNTYRS